MKLFLPVIASLFISQAAMAGNAFNLKMLGFSKDNTKVAFAQSTISDGSGFGVAYVSVIDVKGNKVVKRVNATDESETETTEDRALEAALSQINLNDYGIKAGENLGTTLIDRLPTDYSNVTNAIFSLESWAEGGASATVPKYELSLTTKKTTSEECYDMGTPSLLKLVLKNKTSNANAINLVMQEDKSLPKSRGCALEYGIKKVVISGDSLVTMIQYSTPGFEGPDTLFMAVTAEAKLR